MHYRYGLYTIMLLGASHALLGTLTSINQNAIGNPDDFEHIATLDAKAAENFSTAAGLAAVVAIIANSTEGLHFEVTSETNFVEIARLMHGRDRGKALKSELRVYGSKKPLQYIIQITVPKPVNDGTCR